MAKSKIGASTVAKFAAACLLILSAPLASAAPVTINFDDMASGIYPANFVSQGIIFSPSCHYDINRSPTSSNWIGFDGSGCSDGSPVKNNDYLGLELGSFARLYVASEAGDVFNLNSLKFVTGRFDSGGFSIRSSAGGLATYDWSGGNEVVYEFRGPEWINLQWLVFSTSNGEPVGFDDLALQVHHIDEPPPLALLGLCLFSLTMLRRRTPDQR